MSSLEAVVGAKPRPHVLCVNPLPDGVWNATERLVDKRGGHLDTVDGLAGVHLPTYDVVILADRQIYWPDSQPMIPPSVRTICFYGDEAVELDVGPPMSQSGGTRLWGVRVVLPQSSPRVFDRPQDLALQRLLESTIVPVVHAAPLTHTYSMLDEYRAPGWTALIQGTKNRAVVARYKRPFFVRQVESGADCILVPAWVAWPGKWVEWAFDTWADEGHAAFGFNENWQDDSEWMTKEELEALDVKRAQVGRLESELAILQQAVDAATREQEAASEAAATGHRRLLTDDSDSLVTAVQNALGAIGFDTQKMDDDVSRKVEDLRVTDPDEPGWIAIVEVKGTTKGASLDFFAQVNRAATTFGVATGRLPSARWIVVNHLRERPPSGREVLYAADPEKLSEFANEDQGLVIDTRDLFRAVRTMPDDSVKPLLRDARGRFTYPPQ